MLAHPGLSKSDCLSLHTTREANKISQSTAEMTFKMQIMTDKIKKLTRWIFYFTIVATAATCLSAGVTSCELYTKQKTAFRSQIDEFVNESLDGIIKLHKNHL
jgi:hypothetical protein